MIDTDPRIPAAEWTRFGTGIMQALGSPPAIAAEIAQHLVDADLCGVYSHGVLRLDWHAERAAAGRFDAASVPKPGTAEGGGLLVDGMNWICIAVDLSRCRAPVAFRAAAEECLAELRACPPASGIDRVEIPGERAAALRRERLVHGIPVPPATLEGLRQLGARLGMPIIELV